MILKELVLKRFILGVCGDCERTNFRLSSLRGSLLN